MKRIYKQIVAVLLLATSFFVFVGCELFLSPKSIRQEDVVKSLYDDFGITVAEIYFDIGLRWGANEKASFCELDDFNEALAIGEYRTGRGAICVLYIRTNTTDINEEKLVFYVSTVRQTKNNRWRGEKVETKDCIYVRDYPYKYGYRDYYEACQGIPDPYFKKEMLRCFREEIGFDYDIKRQESVFFVDGPYEKYYFYVDTKDGVDTIQIHCGEEIVYEKVMPVGSTK